MKVVCIDNNMPWSVNDNRFVNITIGKIYDAIDYDSTIYLVIDNSGQQGVYMKFLFKTVKEYREKKLKRILNGNR